MATGELVSLSEQQLVDCDHEVYEFLFTNIQEKERVFHSFTCSHVSCFFFFCLEYDYASLALDCGVSQLLMSMFCPDLSVTQPNRFQSVSILCSNELSFPALQCDPEERGSCDSGCNGGLMNNAFEYILKAGGVVSEQAYPYTGTDGKCSFDNSKVVAKVANFSVVSLDEDQIAANLVKHGPLAGTPYC